MLGAGSAGPGQAPARREDLNLDFVISLGCVDLSQSPLDLSQCRVRRG